MSVYPINTKQTIETTVMNLVNRNYRGFVWKYTVEKHLIKMKESIEESIKDCTRYINSSKNDHDSKYWEKVLDVVKVIKPEPHDCNIDYNLNT